MLTPSAKDKNRKEELERKKTNPADWGPPITPEMVKKHQDAKSRSSSNR